MDQQRIGFLYGPFFLQMFMEPLDNPRHEKPLSQCTNWKAQAPPTIQKPLMYRTFGQMHMTSTHKCPAFRLVCRFSMKWQSWNRVLGLSSRAIFLTTQRLLDVAAVVQLDLGFGALSPNEPRCSHQDMPKSTSLKVQNTHTHTYT